MRVTYPRPPYPSDYSRFLRGEYVEAGWSLSVGGEYVVARCECTSRHKTYLRSGNLTQEYVSSKIQWLFSSTCYGAD